MEVGHAERRLLTPIEPVPAGGVEDPPKREAALKHQNENAETEVGGIAKGDGSHARRPSRSGSCGRRRRRLVRRPLGLARTMVTARGADPR